MSKISSLLAALSLPLLVSLAQAAPQFPFPQNKAYPYGNTFKSAETGKIKEHFLTWKGAWYTEAGTYYQRCSTCGNEDANKSMPSGTARVISPSYNSEQSVSEGIAYGMLLMVYMSDAQKDYQSEFDKLWKYWKCYGKGLNGNGCSSWSGQGMDWRIDNFKGSVDQGSASDADFDAALALIMASKQWNNSTYLSEAKQLINWMKSNDMESDGRIRPGSNWNTAFNPSYATISHFKLFADVTGDAFWNTAIATTMDHLRKCQNAKTGLMPDWCDWNSHQATQTGAAVSGGYLGFFDDAARTPWRLAWGYAWYGIEKGKEANDAIIDWLDSSTYGYAGMIYPGYKLDGVSPSEVFVSSTYSGGLGLSMLSADNPKSYLEGLYYTLINTEGKVSLTANKGEEYFASTLNVLYLLTLTGNLPNFYNMTGFTSFTPDPKAVQTPKEPSGVLQSKEAHANVSGFEFWGTYADKFGTTKMYPDTGSTGIYQAEDGAYRIAYEAFIMTEPTYEPKVELDYPFAGISCSFAEDESYFDLLDLTTIRITYKSQGVIRFALLDEETLIQDQEGGEPGFYLQPSPTWKQLDIDITADSRDKFNSLSYPSWVNFENDRSDVLKKVRGIKFDVKMSKGGYASFDLAGVELLDANGQVVNALKNLNTPIPTRINQQHLISLAGDQIVYSNLNQAKLQIFNINGSLVEKRFLNGSGTIPLESLGLEKGVYMLRLKTSQGVSTLRLVR